MNPDSQVKPDRDRDDLDWDGLFDSLTSSSWQVALVVAGGGSGAVVRCFRRPGASLNFVEAVIPYSRLSMTNYLSVEPRGTSVSPQRAHQLAASALSRADSFTDSDGAYEGVGLALVAALPTLRQRRGSDRIHVALHRESSQILWSLDLTDDFSDRETAESLADEMIFIALSELTVNGSEPSTDRWLCRLRCGLTLIRQGS